MNHFFKLAAISAIFVTTLGFAETIKKDSAVICKLSNGDFQVGTAKTLYKDGSIQLDMNITLSVDGYVYGVKSGLVRIDAKSCTLFQPVSENENDFKVDQSVICETGKSWEGVGFHKELGKIKAVFKGKIFVEVDSVLKDDGTMESVGFERLVSNKACTAEETVEEIEVNSADRGNKKESDSTSGKEQRKISTSKQ